MIAAKILEYVHVHDESSHTLTLVLILPRYKDMGSKNMALELARIHSAGKVQIEAVTDDT